MTWVFLSAVLIAALFTDLRTMTIPNWLTSGGALLGLGWHFASQGWNGLAQSAVGLAAGFSVVLALHAAGAVGAGDVKLFAAIGAITGASFALMTLMYSVLVAAVVGLLLLTARNRLLHTVHEIWGSVVAVFRLRELSAFSRWKDDEALRFPFMIAVAPGAALAFAMMQSF